MLKLWQVRWSTLLTNSDYTQLFFSKENAEYFAIEKAGIISEVNDIWEYTARNFGEKITTMIEERTDKDGMFTMWYKEDKSFEQEVMELATEAELDCSCEIWCTFDNSDVEVYALSVAWVYRGELHHYTNTLEVR